MTDALVAVDSAARQRFVVFGSLPPTARDLDVVAPASELGGIARRLREAGFEPAAGALVRFRGCAADVVELVAVEEWGLAPDERRALFAEAVPIEGALHACRPAPHHSILIAARRAVGEGARLGERARGRIAAALEEDSSALRTATARARGWGATRALLALERAYGERRALPLVERAQALAEIRRAAGGSRMLAAAATARKLAPRRRRRGVVIALSGLDGSGKSMQARALADALGSLGLRANVAWSSVASHPPWLAAAARRIKRVVTLASRAPGPPPSDPGAPRGSDEPASRIRRRSRALTFGWSTIVSARAAFEVAMATRPQLIRGTTVVCDRYLLDSWVHLRYQYGEERRFAFQLALLRMAAPRPRMAYLLDVSPRTASERKPEYSVAQNARRAALYRAGAAELGVRAVDGDRPAEEICAELAREVVGALARRGR